MKRVLSAVLIAGFATSATCTAAVGSEPSPNEIATGSVAKPTKPRNYSSGLTQAQIDEKFGDREQPRVNERAFTEGSTVMQWGNQKHFSTIRDGRFIHYWTDIEPGSLAHKATHNGDMPGGDYVGTPVTVNHGDEQHFIGRTWNGQIRHNMWSPSTGLIESSFHRNQNAPHAAHDPAVAWMNNQLHLFYVDNQGKLAHHWSDNSKEKWSHRDIWSDHAGAEAKNVRYVGKPSLFQWHDQQHVLVRTADHRIAHFFWFPGSHGIQFGFWNSTPAMSDPVTLATPETQSIFYIDVYGHVQRMRWKARENKTDEYNWSKAHSEEPIMATGRPQVFEVYGQEHVAVRHIDGSISHSFKHEVDSKPIHGEWFGPGSTRENIAAGRIYESQDIIYIDNNGAVKHRLWRPNAPAGEDHFVSHEWGHVKKLAPETIELSTDTQLRAGVGKEGALYITEVTKSGKPYVHSAPRFTEDMWGGNPHDHPQLKSQAMANVHTQPSGTASVWLAAGARKAQLTGTTDQGAVHTVHETIGGRGEFTNHSTISTYKANGPVESAVNRNFDNQAVGHVVHTKHGVLFARNDKEMTGGGSPERLRWRRIHHGWLGNKNIAIASNSGEDFQAYFIDHDGRAVSGRVRKHGQHVGWKKLPGLPHNQRITGRLSAAAYKDGAQRLVARSESGDIYTIAQDLKHGSPENNRWAWSWQKISHEKTVGNPDLITVADGTMRVAVRNEANRILIASSSPHEERKINSLRRAHGPAGDTIMASDLELVTIPGRDQFKYLLIGKTREDRMFIVGAGRNNDTGIQSHGAEFLKPVKVHAAK